MADLTECKLALAKAKWEALKRYHAKPEGYVAHLPWWLMKLWDRELSSNYAAARILGFRAYVIDAARQAQDGPPSCTRRTKRRTNYYVPAEVIEWALARNLKVEPPRDPPPLFERRYFRERG